MAATVTYENIGLHLDQRLDLQELQISEAGCRHGHVLVGVVTAIAVSRAPTQYLIDRRHEAGSDSAPFWRSNVHVPGTSSSS